MHAYLSIALGLSLLAGPALAATADITIHAIHADGIGQPLGTIRAGDSGKGLTFTPRLHGLPPGAHGFHVHENGACGPAMKDGKPTAGLAAGGHFDPGNTGMHKGPWAEGGHKGDLPALAVTSDGTATDPVVAPHLKLADIRGKAVIIHAGGDNYADTPSPLGGGGARIACGVVP